MCFIFYLELTNELTNISFCLGTRYDPVVIVDNEPLGSYNNPIVIPDDIPLRRSPRLAARSRTSSPSPSTSAPITITPAQPTTQVTTDSDPAATFVANYLNRSRLRLQARDQPQTRTEFVRRYGKACYEKFKWRWDGAKRNERR